MPAGRGKDGPGWLHHRALNGPGDEQLISVASDFSRSCVSNVQKAKVKKFLHFQGAEFNSPKLFAIISS